MRRRSLTAVLLALAVTLPLPAGTASATGPTTVVTVEPVGHSGAGAAGTCLLYRVVPRDAVYEPTVAAAGQGFVTVLLRELGDPAQQDVDFCVLSGSGDAITRAPKYASGNPNAPVNQLYNPGESLTPEEPNNPVKTRQDVPPAATSTNPAGRPDVAAVEPPTSPTPANNVKGTDTATFGYDSDAGDFIFGIAGMVPGDARISAFFDKNGNGDADTAAPTPLEPGGDVHAEDVTTTFSSGGAPWSVAAANAVRSLEASPKSATVTAGRTSGAPLSAVVRNTEGYAVAGVVPRLAPEAGANAADTPGWTGSCGATNATGRASCSYSGSSAGSDTVVIWVNQAIAGATAGRDAGEPFDTVDVRVDAPTNAAPSATASASPTAQASPTAEVSPTATASTTPASEPSASATSAPCAATSVTPSAAAVTATHPASVVVRASAGRTVQLLAYSRPSTTYRVVREGVTDADGTVTFVLWPLTNTRLYAVEPGCPASPSQVVQVRSALTLGATRTGVRTVDFRGRVVPARRGQLVSLYRVTPDGRQVLAAQTRADDDGTWALRRTFSGTGRLGFVARTGSDVVSVSGTSPLRSVTVR